GKREASIFTNVDPSGNLKLNNLRENTSRIYALKGQNNDRMSSGTDEWSGSWRDSIQLNEDTSNIQSEVSKADPKDLRTLETRFEPTFNIVLTFTKLIDQPKINDLYPLEVNDTKIERYSSHKDSVKIYIPNTELDSIKLELRDAERILDTILIRTNKN